jgi:hypothetical protein
VLCAMNLPLAALAGRATEAIRVKSKAVMGRGDSLLLGPTGGRAAVSMGVFPFYLRRRM